MVTNGVFNNIKKLATNVLPVGSSIFLYGSRARGDFHDYSDWDLLILLDKENIENSDYDLLYEFNKLGATMDEIFVPIVYTKKQWEQRRGTDFFNNVENDKIEII